MRCPAVLLCMIAATLRAQQPVPGPPRPRPPSDSARADSVPPPPTPEQERFLLGLKTASRGVAQLRDGVDRVVRTQTSGDTVKQKLAGKRLGGLCTAARGFLNRGRPTMKPTAYDLPARNLARQLAAQIDSLIAFTPTCEGGASKAPGKVASELQMRLKVYEAALKEFRAAIGLPNR